MTATIQHTDATELRSALLDWSERTRRDLPWRRTRDPWAVLVAEAMLQQTQVSRVEPRYHAFLDRFPTATACAAAPQADTVVLWHGLGYNRRAVALWSAATVIETEHGGIVPADLHSLMSLPGVGAYTARAVLVFAFENDIGVLDTNAARVLARAVAGRRLAGREAQALADALVPRGSGWAWNQAMLDLGATVCTKRVPACSRCPIRVHCAWAARDNTAPDPAERTAGVSGRQSTFAGSDRQGRGRLVAALRHGPVDRDRLSAVMGWPCDESRAVRVASTLIADGLVRSTTAGYELA